MQHKISKNSDKSLKRHNILPIITTEAEKPYLAVIISVDQGKGSCAMKKAGCIRYICIILLGVIAVGGHNSFLLAQEKPAENTETLDFRRIADDNRFNNAYSFYELKLYDKALNLLGEYLEVYTFGLHRMRALQTVADIHQKRYDYQKAYDTWSRLYEEFSSFDEGVDARYQMGVCLQKMGNEEEAAKIFREVIEEYPASSVAARARMHADVQELLK